MTETVIIAVSDANIRYLLQRYAEESGFRATGVSRGDDALELLSEQADPALVILDAGLREIWGARILTAACLRQIPVVMYACQEEPAGGTSDGEWPDGVTGYLPRSVMYDDFVAELARAGLDVATDSR